MEPLTLVTVYTVVCIIVVYECCLCPLVVSTYMYTGTVVWCVCSLKNLMVLEARENMLKTLPK